MQTSTLLITAAAYSCACYAGLIGNDYSGNLYDVNVATGAATNARPTGIANLAGISFGPGGLLYGLSLQPDTASLYRINPTTGASTLIGSSAVASPFVDNFNEGDLRFDPALNAFRAVEYYTVSGFPPAHQMFQINPATGAISNRTNLPCFNNSCVADYSALTIGPTGTIYALDTASLDPFGHLATLSGGPGNVFLSGPLGAYAGMDIDPATGTLYVADGGTGGGNLYSLDASTGNLTAIGSLGLRDGLAGLAFTPTPEPASIGLAGLALAGMALMRARMRN